MDILSCPGALLALNDLTILFNSPTISGCNEMDSERELLKKSFGDGILGFYYRYLIVHVRKLAY